MTEEQIRKRLSIYLDEHDFEIPLFVDMVDFAQEIATEVTKELEKERLRIIGVCSDREEGLRRKIAELEKGNKELKEFYENEYFQISDRTADEKIKELENHQVEVTIDDYSPYDPNTWGDMHEEWFVPKEEVRDLLKENYALITKAKEIIKKLRALYFSPVVTNDDVKRQGEVLNEVEQFLNSEVEK